MRFVELKTEEQPDMQTLHRIRDQLVGDRTSLMNQIRSLLLERGHIPNPRGGKWSSSVLVASKGRGDGILGNRLYIGELAYNRTSKHLDPVSRTHRIRRNPEIEWQMTPVPELPIVERELFERVQAQLEARSIALPHMERRPKRLLLQLEHLENEKVVRLHRAIASDYRRQVASLQTTLVGDGDTQLRNEVAARLRTLIDSVSVTPAVTGKGVAIEFTGRLARLLELATGKEFGDAGMLMLERVKGICSTVPHC